jgi:hypothetical protein
MFRLQNLSLFKTKCLISRITGQVKKPAFSHELLKLEPKIVSEEIINRGRLRS